MIELVLQMALLFVFGAVLVASTDMLVTAVQHLSRLTKMSKFGITALVMAVATSLPELMVGIMSAIEGKPSLSLGNVLGSNMANLALVVGGAAIVGGGITMLGGFLYRELLAGFFVGTLPLVLLVDGQLSRWDGLLLILAYLVFVRNLIFERPVSLVSEEGETVEPIYARFFVFFRRKAIRRNIRQLLLGIVMLGGSAYALVELAQGIAVGLKVPLFLIGLLVSLGTSLPELSFAMRAIKTRQVSMILGNLLGSIAANSGFVLGVVALIRPVTPNGGVTPYLLGTIGYVGLFILFWIFAATKKKLARWEGVVLVLVYLAVMVVEFLRT